jgi:peptidyl-prolyl cis-trans isomerase C
VHAWLRRIVRVGREPLLHFAALGGLAFALSRETVSDELVVTRAQQEQLVQAFERERGRPPSEEERATIVARFVDEELLYRDAIELGLDRDDPMIRRRVLQKMEFVGTNLELPQEPDDATLRTFMAEHALRYAGAPRVDLETVGVRGDEAQAKVILDRLQQGDDPKQVDGNYAAGRRFSASHVARTYGPQVAATVAGLPPNTWAIVALEGGFVLVRVTGLHAGEALPFDKIRNRLIVDWQAEQRRVALQQRVQELRERVQVVVEP